MRLLLLVVLLLAMACVGDPVAPVCWPVGTDTVGVVMRRDPATLLVSECIWLINDKPYCGPKNAPPKCVVGRPVAEVF